MRALCRGRARTGGCPRRRGGTLWAQRCGCEYRLANDLASTNPVSTSVSKSASSSGVAGTRDSRKSRTTARLNPRLLVFTDPLNDRDGR